MTHNLQSSITYTLLDALTSILAIVALSLQRFRVHLDGFGNGNREKLVLSRSGRSS